MVEVRRFQEGDLREAETLARRSKYTSTFGRLHAFRGAPVVFVAVSGGRIVGLVQGKHLVRSPVSMVYNIVVDAEHRSLGVGRSLLRAVWEESPHRVIRLYVDESNAPGLAAFTALGFREVGRRVSGRIKLPLIVLEASAIAETGKVA